MFIPKEFKPLVIPPYTETRVQEWHLAIKSPPPKSGPKRVLAYWSLLPAAMPKDNWCLMQGDTVWMSVTPMELQSQSMHARLAYGNVVVMGLGMGVLVYNLMQNPKVQSITVVEKEPAVVQILNQAAEWFRRPLKPLAVVNEDALHYKPHDPVDTLVIDIWPCLGQDSTQKDTRQIQSQVQAKQVGWWGQELDIVSWLLEQGRRPPLTKQDVSDYQQAMGFRIIGTQFDVYHKLVFMAAINAVREYGYRTGNSIP